MVRKLSSWLVVALVGGAFVAGCGSSTNTPSSSHAAPTATTPTATTPTATTATPRAAKTTSTGTATGASEVQARKKQIAEECRRLSKRSLSASDRATLDVLCKKLR